MNLFTERQTCRVSGGPLIEVLDLGELPISCFPGINEQLPERYPVKLCLNEESGLVQLKHTVDPDFMYKEYWYMSGVNDSMTKALASIVEQAILRTGRKAKTVLDIACNDGTLLKAYSGRYERIGIDPSNLVPDYCDHFINDYFSEEVYRKEMGGKQADIITSIAMFYDLEDPLSFTKDVASILAKDGLWVIELSYLYSMLENNAFETICAEHLEYYSLQSIEYILNKAGLEVEDVEVNDVNGGSFRLYIRHKDYVRPTQAVVKLRELEKNVGLLECDTYRAFSERVEVNKSRIINFLHKAKKNKDLVLGYGASTKGNTIMAYYGIDEELMPFVADRNPIKIGRKTVTGIPIISEVEARKLNSEYFFVFPYHFMWEFMNREKDFLMSGGKFISPIPHLRFIF